MQVLQAIVQGIVQGLTEFLPISSSAHLIIVPWLLRWDDSVVQSLAFDVSLHLGTLLALLIFFAGDWVRLFHAGVRSIIERRVGDDGDRRMAWYLVFGTIPAGLAGFFAEPYIEKQFYRPDGSADSYRFLVMSLCLAVGGLALWAADYWGRQRRRLDQLTWVDVLVIGLAQMISIIPGVSRSGSTIMAGMAVRLERSEAARFSFLLSAPIIAAAGLKGLLNVVQMFQSGQLTVPDLQVFAVGVVASSISGYMCIRFLLRFLQTHSTALFRSNGNRYLTLALRMKLDDEICYCFHVSKRKILNFIRIHRPRRASQISQCGGAGTGCGWCRPFLEKYFRQSAAERTDPDEMTPEEYAELRAKYVRDGKGVPAPGATPLPEP